MITGAAGSIGSEIVRQIAKYNCKKIVLVDIAETPLFFVELEMKEIFNNCDFAFHVVDVTNELQMEMLFSTYHPEVVYHAAAYKHVPMMEKNPNPLDYLFEVQENMKSQEQPNVPVPKAAMGADLIKFLIMIYLKKKLKFITINVEYGLYSI